MARFTSVATALLVVLALVAIAILASGPHARDALLALWTGSVGSWYALTSATLVRAVPLMLTGAAVAIAFRAGTLNIGAEGQLLLGATGAMTTALAFPHGGLLTSGAGLLAGALAGAAWAGVAAVLRRSFGVLEVISTVMLNFLAVHLVSWLVRGPLQEPTHAYPQSVAVDELSRLPRIAGGGRLHVGILVALVVLLIAGWIIRRTAIGFRLTATGDNPAAAESAGEIDTRQLAFRVLLCSGALAGLAGAIQVFGVTYALYEDISPGYGYTAIAVALLAALDPWWAILSAFGFAALQAGASAMQRDAGVPSTVASVVEATLILAIMALQGRRFFVRRFPAMSAKVSG